MGVVITELDRKRLRILAKRLRGLDLLDRIDILVLAFERGFERGLACGPRQCDAGSQEPEPLRSHGAIPLRRRSSDRIDELTDEHLEQLFDEEGGKVARIAKRMDRSPSWVYQRIAAIMAKKAPQSERPTVDPSPSRPSPA